MNALQNLNKLRTCNQLYNITRNYAFKSDLKIKWVRPAKIECFHPQKSGDLEPMPNLDKTQTALQFRNSKELETANELVKRLFSLEFNPRQKTTELYIREMVWKVHRHPLDKGSIEAKLARWTGAIRAFQEQMEVFPRNKRLKVILKELIERRKKHLKYLRRWDYKKFEWLIENLNLEYKPIPLVSEQINRKDSLRKLTKTYCNNITEDRLLAYRLQMEEEQPAFLQEKIRTLEFLRNEQKECGVEVTIKQEDIDKTQKQLDELLKEIALKEVES